MFTLTNRVALVTGASRGLGFRIAEGLAQAGAHVLVNSRSDRNVAEVVELFTRQGLASSPLAFDVTNAAAAGVAFDGVRSRFGRLDILVCNVGIRLRRPLDEISTQDFSAHLEVNLTAAYTLTKMAAPLMMLNAYGRIIMITSIAGTLARAGDAAYISAKGGLTSLMRAFACEYGGTGITCNAIAPGSFATEINAEILATSAAMEATARRVPIKRSADPREIAGPAVFLASEASSYVTGHELTVDGGYTISF